jgi:glycosyltransferase involved in cell wall biosynthesis
VKVLIGAYACEPGTGSEPGVGWNWTLQVASHGHEVTAITRSNNRPAIEAALRASPVPNLEFSYLDLPRPFPALKRRGGFVGLYAYYYAWQVRLWFRARRLHKARRFDLVHHVTFVNDWAPSGLAGVKAPFVWGPVGGSTHVMPPAFLDPLPPAFRRYEAIRRLVQTTLRRFDPFVEHTRRRADCILTYTEEALEGIPPRHRRKARSIVHVGVHESDVAATVESRPPTRALTVLGGGRLVHWKGHDLLVEAFAGLVGDGNADARLLFTGEGSFRPILEQLVDRLGIGAHVRFLGNLPARDDVYRELAEADLYALPTLRDGPPVAILEAMASATPVLCLDLGATRELVPEFAGIKVRVGTRSQTIAEIRAALLWAYDHPDELREMGRRARAHALREHDWDRIGDEVESVYASVPALRA